MLILLIITEMWIKTMKSYFSLAINKREQCPEQMRKACTQTAVQIGTILPEGNLNIYMKTWNVHSTSKNF